MEKFSINFRKHLKAYLITAAIGLVLGVIIFLLYFYLNEKSILDALNACTLAFGVLLGIGILMWVAAEGLFDFVSYGFKQLGTAVFTKKPNKYHDYASYLEQKNVARASTPNVHFSLMLVSVIFLIALIVLEIVYHAKIG